MSNASPSSAAPQRLPSAIGHREVLHIAWPIVVSMLSFSAMNFVDALWLAPLGTFHLAAAGLGGVLLWSIQAFAHGLLGGLKVVIAQRTGAGDTEAVHRLGWQGLHLALWIGLVQMALAPLGTLLLGLLGASPETLPLADDYFAVRMLGSVPVLAMTALTQYLQGRGHTRPPMFAMLLANIVNAGLDPALIHGFGPIPALGMAGAAWAANLAFGVGGVYLALVAWRDLMGVRRGPSRPLLAEVVRLGLPMGGRFCLEVTSYLVLVGILTSAGDIHVAAHVLVIRTISISFLPGYAMSEAVSVLVGQAVGAGRPELVAEIRRAGTRMAVAFMVACGAAFLAFPGELAEILGARPEVVAIGTELFRIAAAFQIFDALFMVGVGVLNGRGDTRFVFVVSILGAWGLKIPLAWALTLEAGLGAPGAWWSVLGEIVLMWLLVRWRLGRAASAPVPEPVAA